MSSKKKRLLKIGIAVAVLAVIAAVVYFTSFYHADRLKIVDGKVKGLRATWMVGISGGEDSPTYVKLGDITPPKGYKTVSGAADPDGDPITTFFVYEGKDPAKDPGTVRAEPWRGTIEQAAAMEGAEESMILVEKKTYRVVIVPEQAEGQQSVSVYIESPYPDACIRLQAFMPDGEEAERLAELADLATAKVEPGKQVSQLEADFKLNFLDDDRWEYLKKGLFVTLEITLAAVLIGIVLGVLVATVRSTWDQNSENMHRGPGKTVLCGLNGLCKVYLTVIRGTPVVIQLMIMYYIIFTSSRNGEMIAMLAFGINSGAYVAEIIRGGIMSVDRGQLEAGRSLGFNYVQTMWHIIIPQAMKSVLPALANEFIVLLKETSVSGYVAVKDLTKAGDIIRGVTYSPFMPLLAVAAVYLVMVMFFSWLVGILERRLRASDH